MDLSNCKTLRNNPTVEKSLPPEEKVRQALLHWMTCDLGYPKSSIALEKKLADLCPLSSEKIPSRRIDLVVFLQGRPLLLVECKHTRITEKARRQVIGYNYFLKAPFLAIAAKSGFETALFKDGEWQWTKGFPSYNCLLPNETNIHIAVPLQRLTF